MRGKGSRGQRIEHSKKKSSSRHTSQCKKIRRIKAYLVDEPTKPTDPEGTVESLRDDASK